MRPSEFRSLQEFLNATALSLELDRDGMSVGILEYSTLPDNNFQGFETDMAGVRSALDTLTQSEGLTNTGDALMAALEIFQSRGRIGATPTLVLLTDGRTSRQNLNTLDQSLNALDGEGIIRTVVGLGSKVDPNELSLIAGSEGSVTQLDFATLPAFSDELVTTLKAQCAPSKSRCSSVANKLTCPFRPLRVCGPCHD